MSTPFQHLLLLMRHAKSDWADSRLADVDRPLNNRGRSAAPLMARWLSEQGVIPTTILCSTAVRTRQTLQLMLDFWNRECCLVPSPEVRYLEDLYLASWDRILNIASKNCTSSIIMVLGHNPGMEDLASNLSEEEFHMPTGSIAMFEPAGPNWPNDWSQPSQWKCHGIVHPRELGRGTI